MAIAMAAPTSFAATQSSSSATTLKVESDFVSQLWVHLREQDRLLQEMLGRLERIETLVADLQRLIARWPSADGATTPKTTPPLLAEETEPVSQVLPWVIAALALFAALTLAWRQRALERRLATGTSLASQKDAGPSQSPPSSAVPAAASSPAEAPDQALELAEIMLSMGLGHGAAQTLLEQIHRQPKQALRHWLKLLEIYRRNGQQAEFEHSAEELRRHFNVHPEDWRKPEKGRAADKGIEGFPHIVDRLVALWGKPECHEYLEGLLFDNRGGTRQGFPQAVAEELLLLSAIARLRATL